MIELLKIQQNMLHFADLSVWMVLERTETLNACSYPTSHDSALVKNYRSVSDLHILYWAKFSEEEQKLQEGQRRKYYIKNTETGKREWGIKQI